MVLSCEGYGFVHGVDDLGVDRYCIPTDISEIDNSRHRLHCRLHRPGALLSNHSQTHVDAAILIVGGLANHDYRDYDCLGCIYRRLYRDHAGHDPPYLSDPSRRS